MILSSRCRCKALRLRQIEKIFKKKMKFLLLAIVMVMVGAELNNTVTNTTNSTVPTTPVAPPVGATVVDPYATQITCGSSNTPGQDKLKTWSGVYVCLVFTMPDGTTKKVIFKPKMDKFAALEI